MIVGIGTDVAEVRRIRRAIDQHGDRFLARLFTPREIAYASCAANAAERFAARFAAKEAAMKAIGTGWSEGVTWLDFEVSKHPSGKPELSISGFSRTVADSMAVTRVWLSLTHTADIAYAVVVLES